MKRAATLIDTDELAACVSLDALADDSRIILSISPCRSGSTVILRAFGALGIESHLQPLKNLLRWRSLGKEHCWQPHDGALKPIYIKETLGPFIEAEARFDPLSLLLAAGISAEKVTLLVLGRLPLETWASWQLWWPERTSIELFIEAYRQTEAIRQQAQRLGVATTSLVYEAFRDHAAGIVMQRLCQRLGINYGSVAVDGWQQLPHLGEKGSNITIPQMPEEFKTRHIRQRVEQGTELSYCSRAKEAANLSAAEITRIEQAGLPTIYDGWHRMCALDLGLTFKESK